MRVLFALSGLHRYSRGAEIAFISIAKELAKAGNSVTLIGSGPVREAAPYRFLHAPSLAREHFESCPAIPLLRDDCAYEELTFIPGLLRRYNPAEYDVTVTCSYPFTNWALRRPALRVTRPPHVFVTQNGDWPVHAANAEFRFFGCEGLVCTNPEFYERNRSRWPSAMIPNGVDCKRFRPGPPIRDKFGLPEGRLIVLMVSALIPSKGVKMGIEAVSAIPDAFLIVAGDGPMRQEIDALAAQLLPNRFKRVTLPAEQMPLLYRSADIFLHLSKDEAFGNVFVEAMACGLPIIAHDTPRTRWIVGQDEFLFDSSDPGVIMRCLELAHHAPDSQRLSRVSKAAAFSWPEIGKKYQEFLTETVTQNRSR